jgi:hypothetical protein
MRKTASILSIVFGILMMIGGIVAWVVVTDTLSDQRITVAGDASCLADRKVQDPLTAWCQAEVINKHTEEITGGQTYAELDQDDPDRETAMDSAFLQASLYTSVVAFGVAAMAVVIGLLFTLVGFALRGRGEGQQA